MFDVHTAETLLHVLDSVAEQVHAAGVSREDFSELKQLVAEIAEAQKKIDVTLQRLSEKVEQLFEAQRRTDEQIRQLFSIMQQHDQRLTNIEADVSTLKSDVKVLKDDVGKLKGYALETRYRDRVTSYFGRLLRRSKVVDLNNSRYAVPSPPAPSPRGRGEHLENACLVSPRPLGEGAGGEGA